MCMSPTASTIEFDEEGLGPAQPPARCRKAQPHSPSIISRERASSALEAASEIISCSEGCNGVQKYASASWLLVHLVAPYALLPQAKTYQI